MNPYLLMVLKAVVALGALLATLLYIQWVERKVIAHIQRRLGPYRVGPHGLLQPVADTLKLLFKEDLFPTHVNRLLYLLAPFLAVTLALISIAVIPFGPEIELAGVRTWLQLTDLNVGVLFVLAISSLTVYAIVLAGWSSNSKYPLLGGLRSAAQMVGYELPLGMAVAAPLLMAGSLSLREIVLSQQTFYGGFLPGWNLFRMPFPQVISFVIFLIAAFAETNRVPFDLPEAENELVAGFHTEYSSLKFASFFMAEYANMITACALATTLFLGGWLPPFPVAYGSNYLPSAGRDRLTLPAAGIAAILAGAVLLIPAVQELVMPLVWFLAKTGFLLLVFIWVRGTLPRLRYDQLMRFTWTFLFPVGVLNLMATGLVVALGS